MEKEAKEPGKVLKFFMDSLNGMAYGLFATLIIGTIFATIGGLFERGAGNAFCDFMVTILGKNGGDKGLSYLLQGLTGAGIGVGIALALKLESLKVVVLGAVGEAASYFSLKTSFVTDSTHPTADAFKPGDPLTVFFVCILVALLFKYVIKKKTPVDILLIPFSGLTLGLALSVALRYPLVYVTYGMQWLVNAGTNVVPYLMGVVVAVLMGIALTAPISSAAIAAVIFAPLSGVSASVALADASLRGLALASGAAVIGCSTQMVGFAVQSRKDNSIGMVISIGIGTSMLQFKNILRKPVIWLPTIIVSAILGPISTCFLELVCGGASSGMGTAGLVGQIGTFASMGFDCWQAYVGVFALQIVLPAALVFLFDLLFRKIGLISEGDLKI